MFIEIPYDDEILFPPQEEFNELPPCSGVVLMDGIQWMGHIFWSAETLLN